MQFGWTADEPTAQQILSAAFEAGIYFIDTADIYSRWVPGNPGGVAEEIIGRWIKQAHIPRERLVLATKVRGELGEGPNNEGLSRAHIILAVEGSLRRLQVESIDLYQAHWFDAQTPVEETLRAFDDLLRQGKVRYLGCSNYPAWRLMQALWAADAGGLEGYISLQPHYNLVNRAEFERELAEVCQTYGLGVLPYSPLAGGFLTGKYHREQIEAGSKRNVSKHFSDRNWALLAVVEKAAAGLGVSPSQIALAWLLHQKSVTSPIIGPRSLEQLNDNLGALEVQLPEEWLKALNEASAWG
jgi:aryl-alcohol dehydrogenase-like predicted oxidoreductase